MTTAKVSGAIARCCNLVHDPTTIAHLLWKF